jgi:hypothetical protein
MSLNPATGEPMIPMCRCFVIIIATCAMLGCPMSGSSARNIKPLPPPSEASAARQTAQRPGENPQTAYRRELLNTQLRHAQMDLQAATNESERQSIQERIDMIQQVLASLEAR